MKELDLLKKHWNQNTDFPKVSQEEIRSMIHKKSSSIVKWIFFISIAEFVLLNTLGFLMPNDSEPLHNLVAYVDVLSLVFSAAFIFLFYRNYRAISVSSTTKDLMQCILKTRKTVKYYIYINLSIVTLLMIYVAIESIQTEFQIEHPIPMKITLYVFVALCFIIAMVGMALLVYRLLYGILLRRLKKNYTELKKLDF